MKCRVSIVAVLSPGTALHRRHAVVGSGRCDLWHQASRGTGQQHGGRRATSQGEDRLQRSAAERVGTALRLAEVPLDARTRRACLAA